MLALRGEGGTTDVVTASADVMTALSVWSGDVR